MQEMPKGELQPGIWAFEHEAWHVTKCIENLHQI